MESKVARPARQVKTSPSARCSEVVDSTPARPMRAMLLHLSEQEPTPYGRERLAQHAETSMRVIQLGLGAIGHLLSHAAVQVEDRTIPAECMESLGTLMAELSELASMCYQFSVGSRNQVRDAAKEGAS